MNIFLAIGCLLAFGPFVPFVLIVAVSLLSILLNKLNAAMDTIVILAFKLGDRCYDRTPDYVICAIILSGVPFLVYGSM
jgi:hypothetical protein